MVHLDISCYEYLCPIDDHLCLTFLAMSKARANFTRFHNAILSHVRLCIEKFCDMIICAQFNHYLNFMMESISVIFWQNQQWKFRSQLWCLCNFQLNHIYYLFQHSFNWDMPKPLSYKQKFIKLKMFTKKSQLSSLANIITPIFAYCQKFLERNMKIHRFSTKPHLLSVPAFFQLRHAKTFAI